MHLPLAIAMVATAHFFQKVDSRGSTNDRIIDGDEKHTHL
jgi:hypothetical protein